MRPEGRKARASPCPDTSANGSGDPFRVVLTDLHMPEWMALGWSRRCRRLRRRSSVVLMVTSGEHSGDLALARDGIALSNKPVRRAELRAAVSGPCRAENTLRVTARARSRVPREGRVRIFAQGAEASVSCWPKITPSTRKCPRHLEKAGHTVEVARDGREAVRIVARIVRRGPDGRPDAGNGRFRSYRRIREMEKHTGLTRQ